MKHSDEKDTYMGNATRNARKGKGRYDLISPRATRRLARVFEDGVEGHGARNWEQGILMSRFIDSAQRHIGDYMLGKDDEDHLAMAEWNLHCAIHTEEECMDGNLPKSLLDLPRHCDIDKDVTVCACEHNKVEILPFEEEWARQPVKETP